MQTFRGKRWERRKVEPFEQIECDQCCDSLSIGRAFINTQSAIRNRNRLFPRGDMGCEILQRHAASSFFDDTDYRLGDRALIECVPASAGNKLECPGQVRVAEDLACFWA